MRFSLKKPSENMASLARRIGYRLITTTPDQEFNLIRPLSRDYPRFHLYVKDWGGALEFSLHLDQKRPSYGRETAHSGEYDGTLVEGEEQRIKEALTKL